MEFEKQEIFEGFEKPCKKEKIEINGVIENGKQFDLDIKLPEDYSNQFCIGILLTKNHSYT